MALYYVSYATLLPGTIVNKYGNRPEFMDTFHFVNNAMPNFSTRHELTIALADFQSSRGFSDSDPEQTLGVFAREAVLEKIRDAEFAHRPSRLSSVFLTDDYRFAWQFLFQYRRGDGWIYECDAVTQNLFKSDMDVVSNAQCFLNNPAFDDASRSYWLGNPPFRFPEILCPDEVRIIGPANLVYLFDPDNKTFLHSTHLPIHPISGEITFLPNSTSLKPPSLQGKIARFTGLSWELVDSPSRS